jgi:hypothetical protein
MPSPVEPYFANTGQKENAVYHEREGRNISSRFMQQILEIISVEKIMIVLV